MNGIHYPQNHPYFGVIFFELHFHKGKLFRNRQDFDHRNHERGSCYWDGHLKPFEHSRERGFLKA